MSAQPVEAPKPPCIRRWYATYTMCTCPTCRRTNQTIVKRRNAGLQVRVPADAAWAVLSKMLARQWSPTAIASACNLPIGTIAGIIRNHRTGTRRAISSGVAGRILRHGQPVKGYVGTVGTRRRLQALARLGHSLQDITNAGGPPTSTLAPIRRGVTEQIRPEIAAQVDAVWRRLCMTVGTCTRTRRLAEREAWAPPLAWNTIDDPTEIPHGVEGGVTRKDRRDEAVQLVRAGMSIERAAAETGVVTRTVTRALKVAEPDEAAA